VTININFINIMEKSTEKSLGMLKGDCSLNTIKRYRFNSWIFNLESENYLKVCKQEDSSRIMIFKM